MNHEHDRRANRLAGETSPYLLLHAHNPVDWYPWGTEAFAAALEQDKPILLSIGYSTCNWCHVMERESFADPLTAQVLNDAFVCIKVDREERPDLDEQYMQAVQLLTGGGGWPMTVLLTPDLKPFYGGTYYPAEQLRRISSAMSDVWRTDRARITRGADELTEAMDRGGRLSGQRGPALDQAAVATAVAAVLAEQDAVHGGHRGAPKFPQDMADRLLLAEWRRTGQAELLAAATRSLDQMALGGIHDHLGGGFHRYSTDGLWTVPHFEKMLYNQAGLLRTYAAAAAVTGSWWYRHVADGIVAFVARELTDPSTGAFHTAIDAETNGEEGRYYLWTRAEVAEVLGHDAAGFAARYGLDGAPTFHDPRGGATDLSVLRRTEAPDADGFAIREAPLLAKLLARRGTRQRPLTDDKVICAWNGLMIGALAHAGTVLERGEWVRRAERAADFVLRELRAADGRLLHSWRLGQARQPAFLDDHAALANGLLDLHDATGDRRWLACALDLAQAMVEQFGADDGGFYGTPSDATDLLSRTKPIFDNALPSGNSLAAEVLYRLADLGHESLRPVAQATIAALTPLAMRHPYGLANLLRVGQEHLVSADSARTLRVTGRRLDADAVEVVLSVAPGWHVEAHDPGVAGLVATELTAEPARPQCVDYPAGEPLAAGHDGPRVYRGRVPLRVRLPADAQPVTLVLRAQACRDGVCWRPSTLRLSLR